MERDFHLLSMANIECALETVGIENAFARSRRRQQQKSNDYQDKTKIEWWLRRPRSRSERVGRRTKKVKQKGIVIVDVVDNTVSN